MPFFIQREVHTMSRLFGTLPLNIHERLIPYLYLNKTLFDKKDQSRACYYKFSNNGHGVPATTRFALDTLATTICAEPISELGNWLEYVDVLTLYSNHIDQQCYDDDQHPRPVSQKEKEAQVLRFLTAAYKLSPTYDYLNLTQYKPRELSSHAQLLHYFAKAQRYANIPVAERLAMLEQALAIAKYLTTLSLSDVDDPHAYQTRVVTIEFIMTHSLVELGRSEEAKLILLSHLESDSLFHRVQAAVKLAEIAIMDYENGQDTIDLALNYARRAVAESEQNQDDLFTLIHYNARVSLMNAYQAAGYHYEANKIAKAILAEIAENPNCGAKDLHRKAAKIIKIINNLTKSISRMHPPKTPSEAIESRRNPCYGFGVFADLEENEKLMTIFSKTRDAILKIIDPERASNTSCKITSLYKTKILSCGCFWYAAFVR